MVRKFVIDREVKKDAMGWAGDGPGGTHKRTDEEACWKTCALKTASRWGDNVPQNLCG
jgi:hypothetical protein